MQKQNKTKSTKTNLKGEFQILKKVEISIFSNCSTNCFTEENTHIKPQKEKQEKEEIWFSDNPGNALNVCESPFLKVLRLLK